MSLDLHDLTEASFRGVAFAARAIGGKTGRRTVLHEYPGQSIVGAEDLGKKAREHHLAGVITGDDWQTRLGDLLDALETAGAGELRHPEQGLVNAVCTEAGYSVVSVGEVTLDLVFVETGTPLTTSTLDLSAVATAGSSFLSKAKSAIINTWNVVGQVGSVASTMTDRITSRIDTVTGIIQRFGPPAGVRDAVAAMVELRAQAGSLARAPGELADAWANVFDALGSDSASLSQLSAEFADLEVDNVAAIASSATPTEDAIAASTAAQDTYLHRAIMAAWAEAVADTTWTSYDEAIAAVTAVSDALTTSTEGLLERDIVEAATDLRGALSDAVVVEAQDLPHLATYVVPGYAATLEVAQLLYHDGTRADEITGRNGIPHPGFARGSLRVLAV